MRVWRRPIKPTTHYQSVKSRAALYMTVAGCVAFTGTLASLFFAELGVVLFLAGTSLGFFLVGFQQQIDALAASPDDSPRREPDGEQDT